MKLRMRQLFTNYWSIKQLGHTLAGYYVVLRSDEKHKLPKRFYQIGKKVKWYEPQFQQLAESAEQQFTKKALNALSDFLFNEEKKTVEAIRAIPNSPQKAKTALQTLILAEDYGRLEPPQLYDAMVLMREQVTQKLLAKIMRGWIKDYRYHLGHRILWDSDSEIFWDVNTGMEEEDAISRYRFRECFGIDVFSKTFQEVEEYLEIQFTETRSAYLLWLISRSRNLSNRLEDAINIVLRDIEKKAIALLHSDKKIDEDGNPKVASLAQYSLLLAKLATTEQMKETGRLAARYVLRGQQEDGRWPSRRLDRGSQPDFQPKWYDYFPTVIALDAIMRNNIENATEAVEKGIAWLQGQQNEFGLWGDELGEEGRLFYPFPFNTVLVLEVIELAEVWKVNKLLARPIQQQAIFISYSRKDWKEYVEPFVTDLHQNGFKYWLDQNLIQGGQDWLNEVNQALDDCSIMLLFLSPDAISSEWVKMEYRYFIHHKKTIIPLMCREAKLPAELLSLHRLSYSDFQKVVTRLNSLAK